MTKTKVILLFGGRSAEHEVSLLSARNVLAALDRERFEPHLIGIDPQGRWHGESERTLAAATGDPRVVALDPHAPAVRIEDGLAGAPAGHLASSSGPRAIGEVVVFPILHGTFGEDGTVQGLLELGDVAYVGSGVLGSAIGMDKDVAKRLLRGAGIPIVDYEVVTAAAFARDPKRALAGAARFGYPMFVKPANAGSSVGVSRVTEPEALEPAVRAALAFDRKVLIERAVDGAREIECGVLGNDDPVASVPGEIVVNHRDGFYSYDAKYVDPDGATWKIPADLPVAVRARVQGLAVEAFRVLELAGMARVDFFLGRDGELAVNEVNTIPGFTAVSMYPKMWEASGLSQRDLVTRLVDLALERRDARRMLRTGVVPRLSDP
jgi:D-alanine-D-alanine ligase